ncbi:hypothetical protein ACEWY4_012727 [Coilia grayii]|uniref:RING finger protein 207 n=1 Tax=Coilia grayii TaxID=363190 RepID=A0ABD1JUC7_9TELE
MMSGGIFPASERLWEPEYASCHPLVCLLCHGQYQQPCLLDCYHIFCASCLRGRARDNRLSCPLCGYPTVVKGVNSLPPEDRLLKFLVDNSSDSLETVQCSNCDMESRMQDAGAMYYCNTCSQPLCAECRENTHRAKMFSKHEIVSLAKRAKQGHRRCSLHDEHYIMFSTEKKSMLCINCFRDMQVESRTHCMDIETAYAQGCEILDQAVMAVKELQTSARESIVLLKAMIGEVRSNVEEEENAICCLFKSMQVHLVACSAFLSSANKFDFLDMGYQLMERLRRIVKLPHKLRPTQSSKINTDYHAEFARSLESLLPLGHRRPASITGGSSISAWSVLLFPSSLSVLV